MARGATLPVLNTEQVPRSSYSSWKIHRRRFLHDKADTVSEIFTLHIFQAVLHVPLQEALDAWPQTCQGLRAGSLAHRIVHSHPVCTAMRLTVWEPDAMNGFASDSACCDHQ